MYKIIVRKMTLTFIANTSQTPLMYILRFCHSNIGDFWYQKVHCYISFWLDPLFWMQNFWQHLLEDILTFNSIIFAFFYVWRFISWISCDVPFCVYKIIIQPSNFYFFWLYPKKKKRKKKEKHTCLVMNLWS